MPREHRKRGKRKKNEIQNEEQEMDVDVEQETAEQLPSWIEPATLNETINPEAPFGFCDPDVKAYFRTVEKQLREWQELGIAEKESDTVEDPNLERRMFFAAALGEMQGKERQLATDPDCAIILERMIYSMDDLARRIFANSLLGSIVQLAEHRFGSHVLETLLEVGAETIDRETRGIFPAAQSLPQFAEQPTLSDIISQMSQEILPLAASFVNKPFASHVLQRLLMLLVPELSSLEDKREMRSKRSAGYKAKQGPMKSVFESAPQAPTKQVPSQFANLAKEMLESTRQKLSPSEVRALAADKVGCVTLRVLIVLEALNKASNEPNSLMDDLLMGMISHHHQSNSSPPPESDYITTLFRDATASHLLETLIQHAPKHILFSIWDLYLAGKLGRLALHPVANFIVSQATLRLEQERFKNAVEEMSKVIPKCIKQQRIGPVTALVNRAGALHTLEGAVVEAICDGVDVNVSSPEGLIERILGTNGTSNSNDAEASTSNPRFTSSIQGALLLQALTRLDSPYNEVITQSFEKLSPEQRLAIAHDSTSSRVIDAIFESPTTTRKAKRGVILAYIGQYQLLVDDRIGSRVGDRCWANADPFLKEKIARSLIPHQQFLAASYYGKFFVRKLQLALLQRRPEEWKVAQTKAAQETSPNPSRGEPVLIQNEEQKMEVEDEEPRQKKKRKRDEQKDEIDVLFDGVKENRFSHVTTKPIKTDGSKASGDLDKVLGAIKAAPKGERKRRKG